MAEPSDGRAKISTSVSLTEDDIPGAKLPKETPEECNCWMLRRWLQCRGGRTTGKKAVLVQRVKDYMKLNCKLVDPDGGVNVAKKKVRLGLCENISPESCNDVLLLQDLDQIRN